MTGRQRNIVELTYSQASRLSRAVDPLEKVRNEIIDDMAEEVEKEAPELTDALIAIGNRIGDIVDEISELINR